MADLSDVQSALVGLLTGALYPNGTGQSSAAGGAACTVYQGWPVPAQLDADLAAHLSNISVFNGDGRKVTKYPKAWQVTGIATPTLTLSASGRSITVGGAMPAPFAAHNMVVLVGGAAFSYPIQQSDTLSTIAAALAALINAQFPGTTSNGAVITLPAGPLIQARVGTVGSTIKEVGRWEQMFQITIWSDSPTNRAAIGKAINPVLFDTPWLSMPDGTAARLIVLRQRETDGGEKAGLYRRDIFVQVEYAETVVQQTATVEAVTVTRQDPNTGATISITSY